MNHHLAAALAATRADDLRRAAAHPSSVSRRADGARSITGMSGLFKTVLAAGVASKDAVV